MLAQGQVKFYNPSRKMQKQAEICLTHHKKYWQWKFHHKPSWLGIIVEGSRGWFLHDAIMWFMQTNDHHCPSNVSTIGLSDLWSVKAKSKSWPAFTKTKLQPELARCSNIIISTNPTLIQLSHEQCIVIHSKNTDFTKTNQHQVRKAIGALAGKTYHDRHDKHD